MENAKLLVVFAVLVASILGLGSMALPSSSASGEPQSGKIIVAAPSFEKALHVIEFKDENSHQLVPDAVSIDGEARNISSSKIAIQSLKEGPHILELLVDGVSYKRSLDFNNNSISVSIQRPVSVVVHASSVLADLEGAVVYSDGQVKCTTDSNGICSFVERAGQHAIKVQSGEFGKESSEILSGGQNTFSFKIERHFSPTFVVLSKDLDVPIAGASVQVDGQGQWFTDQDGNILIPDILEGLHTITASYNGISETKTVEVSSHADIKIGLVYLQKRLSLSV